MRHRDQQRHRRRTRTLAGHDADRESALMLLIRLAGKALPKCIGLYNATTDYFDGMALTC